MTVSYDSLALAISIQLSVSLFSAIRTYRLILAESLVVFHADNLHLAPKIR